MTRRLHSAALLCATLGFGAGSAGAQTTAATPPATPGEAVAPADATAPADSPAAAPSSTPPTSPLPAPTASPTAVPPTPEPHPEAPAAAPTTPPGAATPEAAEPDEPTTPAWFRFDSDFSGLTLWVGATHDLGGVGLATDISVSSGALSGIGSTGVVPFSLAEFDVGPAFSFVDGALLLTPMAGIQFDWVERRTVSLVAPQLFTILDVGPVYFESWAQLFFYGPFTDGARARDSFYTRNFLLYELGDAFALGPHFELTYLFQDGKVSSLPVGGAAMLSYGKGSTLLLALGYETQADARATSGGSGERGIAGRFTFIKTW